MNIYRYKHYDFEKDYLPLGFEWKEPQVFAFESPDEDYEIFQDQEWMDNFVAEKYVINEDEGRLYKHLISGKITNMVTSGIITSEESQIYSEKTKAVREFLNDGYWHSAYFAFETITIDGNLLTLHNEAKEYVKNYVNTKYPLNFYIE